MLYRVKVSRKVKDWKESVYKFIDKIFLFNPGTKIFTITDILFRVNKFNVLLRKYASLENLFKSLHFNEDRNWILRKYFKR